MSYAYRNRKKNLKRQKANFLKLVSDTVNSLTDDPNENKPISKKHFTLSI